MSQVAATPAVRATRAPSIHRTSETFNLQHEFLLDAIDPNSP
jgi:hypothetical protein